MANSSPRWPGAQGGPGLDFSQYQKPSASGPTPKVPAGAAPKKTAKGTPPAAAKAKASSGSAGKSAPSPAGKPAPGPAEKPAAGSAVDRAAKTRQEWASTPVAASAPATSPSAKVAVTPSSPAKTSSAKAPLAGKIVEKVAEKVSTSTTGKGTSRRTRKARLRVARLDPWSVMKTTFLFSIAFGVILWVFVAVLWSIVAASGAFDSMSELANKVFSDGQTTYDVKSIISASRVLGFTAVVAVIDVVIITAVSTLMAFLYNLAATVMGGLELTLAED